MVDVKTLTIVLTFKHNLHNPRVSDIVFADYTIVLILCTCE
jgi:hypothetical protein